MAYKIFLITKGFPYGNTENSFVTREYNCIKEKFTVKVLAAETDVTAKKTYFGAIDAKQIRIESSILEKLFSLGRFLLKRECYIEIKDIVKSREYVAKRIFRALMFGTAAETFYKRFVEVTKITPETEAIVYFYWYDYKCFGFTMHKRKYPNIKLIARTHGYDLYDARELYGRQFFKEQMDRKLDRLIFAAEFAKKYYLERYSKQDGKKYPLHRLGVSDMNVTVEQRKLKLMPDTFILLSCSHTIAIKRVECIAEGLSIIKEHNIHWVHLGSGEQFNQLREYAKQVLGDRKNITFEFTGEVSNDKVIQFYKEHYVGAFITTTSTEGGSPVSVQEALSFGIPIIATAVGELPVMVQENGILLSENPDAEEVAAAIRRICSLYGTDTYYEMCGKSLNIFKDKFDAEKNYREMVRELESLTEEK